MSSTVRWISAFIVWLLLCLSTPAIAQRGESCDAKPRYILVTVLELDFYTRVPVQRWFRSCKTRGYQRENT